MEKEKHFTEWTRKKFEALPRADWKNEIGEVSGLLRLFCDKYLYIGRSLSSFEVFFKED